MAKYEIADIIENVGRLLRREVISKSTIENPEGGVRVEYSFEKFQGRNLRKEDIYSGELLRFIIAKTGEVILENKPSVTIAEDHGKLLFHHLLKQYIARIEAECQRKATDTPPGD